MSATAHDTATDQPVKAARPRLITGKTMDQFKTWAHEQELMASNARLNDCTPANPTPPPSPTSLQSDVATPSTAAAESAAQVTPTARPALTFITHRQMTSRPFPKWRVNGLIPEIGMGLLYGPSGVGKSFLALDLAAHIAAGQPWFGHKVKASTVVYFSLEGQGGMQARTKALDGRFPSEALDRIIYVEDALLFADSPAMGAVVSEMPTGCVVFVDTLNRAMPGLEENSAKDMSTVLHWCNRMARERGCFVLLIHHTGAVEAPKRPRGSSALFAGADASIIVKQGGTKRSQWKADKVKDGEGGQTHEFGIESVNLGHDDDGNLVKGGFVVPVTNGSASMASRAALPAVVLKGNRKLVMDALGVAANNLGQVGGTGIVVPVAAWREAFNSSRHGSSPDATRKAFDREREVLAQLGFLHYDNSNCTLLPTAPGYDGLKLALELAKP